MLVVAWKLIARRVECYRVCQATLFTFGCNWPFMYFVRLDIRYTFLLVALLVCYIVLTWWICNHSWISGDSNISLTRVVVRFFVTVIDRRTLLEYWMYIFSLSLLSGRQTLSSDFSPVSTTPDSLFCSLLLGASRFFSCTATYSPPIEFSSKSTTSHCGGSLACFCDDLFLQDGFPSGSDSPQPADAGVSNSVRPSW